MAWLQGMNNYGIMLKEREDKYEMSFYTANCSDVEDRLYITINYTGLSEQSAYNYGQGIVNESSYYIVNRKTGQYLTATSATTGTSITQQDFRDDYAQTQQWKFTETTSIASYKISLGNTGLCLKNTAGAFGSVIKLGDDLTISAQTWRAFRNWNGTYRFQSKLSPYGSIKEENNADSIIQRQYTCDLNYDDEWTLIPVQKQRASFFDFNISGDINTTYGTGVMRSQSQALAGYTTASRYTNSQAARAFEHLKVTNMFYYSGHGSPGELNFYNANKVSQGDLVVANDLVENSDLDVSIETLTHNSLAQLQLAVLASCDTGRDAILNGRYLDENMTGRLYWLGAHNVISHFHETIQPYDTMWLSAFMTDVLLGRTLKNAKQKADYNVYDDFRGDLYKPYGNLNERHDLGDESYRPGFTPAHALAQRTYGYNETPSLSLSLKPSASTTDVVYDNQTGSAMTIKFGLPKDPNQNDSEESHIYDVYVDSYGGIYWYYTGTDTLHSYEPFTDKVELGETVVNPTSAMERAMAFLSAVGYDVSGCSIETSNQFSKNYTIVFDLDNNAAEKLVFHMQSDVSGEVHIISFTAYNYSR